MKKTFYLKNLKCKPIEIFFDCVKDKNEIYKKYKYVTGIYMWYNKITDKTYIGSGFNLGKRINDYYYNSKLKKGNRKIDNSIKKYTLENFILIILEIISSNNNYKIIKEEYLKREQYYLDLYKPEYNILSIAGSSLGFKHSQETKDKLRNMKKGFKHSQDSIKKLSLIMKGENNPFYGKNHTKESLFNMSNIK